MNPVGLLSLAADPTGVAAGDTYWNSASSTLRTFTGTVWVNGGAQGIQGIQGITGTGTQGIQGIQGIQGAGSSPSAATYAQERGFTSTVSSVTDITLTNTSTPYQRVTGTTAQAVRLPVATTCTNGYTFYIDNDSTATTTVTVSVAGGSATVIAIPALFCARIILGNNALDVAASWDAIYTEFHTYTGSGDMVFSASPTLSGTPLTSAPVSSDRSLQIPTTTFSADSAVVAVLLLGGM
jgi:hypothetical protein